MDKFARVMAAWGGDPRFDLLNPPGGGKDGHMRTRDDLFRENMQRRLWPVLVALLGAALIVGVIGLAKGLEIRREHKAYVLVGEQFGVIKHNPEDGKLFVSFSPRASQRPPVFETEEFLSALRSLEDVPDLRGVHLDGLSVSHRSLEALAGIKSLELVTVRDTPLADPLTEHVRQEFRDRRPGVELWDRYDREHP